MYEMVADRNANAATASCVAMARGGDCHSVGEAVVRHVAEASECGGHAQSYYRLLVCLVLLGNTLSVLFHFIQQCCDLTLHSWYNIRAIYFRIPQYLSNGMAVFFGTLKLFKLVC